MYLRVFLKEECEYSELLSDVLKGVSIVEGCKVEDYYMKKGRMLCTQRRKKEKASLLPPPSTSSSTSYSTSSSQSYPRTSLRMSYHNHDF